MERRAKIVATIGPASHDEQTLKSLILAGVNVARLNFSHGNYKDHEKVIKLLRKISQETGQPLGILQDLQGPKIRVGDLGAEGVPLINGESITLSTLPDTIEDEEIPVTFSQLAIFVKIGGKILLDDGNLELQVTSINTEKTKVETIVVTGGFLKTKKGINLPGVDLTIPGFTKKDEDDLKFGLEQGVDAIAISFVRTAQDIARVRKAVSQYAPHKMGIPIIAKLERPEALDNLDEIIELADGVMVARGDLGVEMSPEVVPIVQKQIIDAANRKGKLVITATQMLESMIIHPRPTRAEATDVANAIFDGSDAVMLSGETASGKYPLESVKMMDAIIRESEKNQTDWGHWHGSGSDMSSDDAVSITRAARELAHDLNVSAIVVFTQTGRTARLMSKALPRVPIIGFTPEDVTYRKMTLYWGVFPYQIPFADTIEQMLAHVDAAMIESTPIKPGQQVVIISGFPLGAMRLPNFALLYTVGQHS